MDEAASNFTTDEHAKISVDPKENGSLLKTIISVSLGTLKINFYCLLKSSPVLFIKHLKKTQHGGPQ